MTVTDGMPVQVVRDGPYSGGDGLRVYEPSDRGVERLLAGHRHADVAIAQEAFRHYVIEDVDGERRSHFAFTSRPCIKGARKTVSSRSLHVLYRPRSV